MHLGKITIQPQLQISFFSMPHILVVIICKNYGARGYDNYYITIVRTKESFKRKQTKKFYNWEQMIVNDLDVMLFVFLFKEKHFCNVIIKLNCKAFHIFDTHDSSRLTSSDIQSPTSVVTNS